MNPILYFQKIMILMIVLGAGVLLSGCGGGTSAPPPVIVVSFSGGSSQSIRQGQSVTITAIVSNDSSGKGVTWTLTGPGSLSKQTSASVEYDAPASVAANVTATVSATSIADPSKSAAFTVTVNPPPAISISVTPSAITMSANTSQQFTATVQNDPSNAGVTWTLTQNGAACAPACGTVLPSGTASDAATTYTGPATPPVSNSMLTLTATSVTDTTKSASATITVPSVAVTVNPSIATVPGTGTTQLTATVAGDASNKGVAWTVTCSPSPCGSVSPASTATGVPTTYTAPGPPPNDLQITVTATSVANSLAMSSATVTVPSITIDVQPPNPTVLGGSTQQLTATVGNDLANKGVTWAVSCSQTECGGVSPTATASGVATTYTALGTPPANDLTVNVTATSVADPTKVTSAAVTIPAIKVSAVSPSSGIIPINATQDFTATSSNDPSNAGVNWSLTQNGTNCSPGCGTVSPASVGSGSPTTYTAPSTLPVNAAVTINAISAADSTKSSTAAITITNGTVKFIPASLSFTCKYSPHKYCPPPAQNISLTNTGSTALTINTISITGANAATFQQTNNCPASADTGASCTVSVVFNPGGVGSYAAFVTFDDKSPNSPQQVALTGQATAVHPEAGADLQSNLAGLTSAAVPAPSGPDFVGTQVVHMTDPAREDPYLKNGTKRELSVRLWYPASLAANQTCRLAEYTSPLVWNHFAQLVGVRPFPVKTNSCLNASVANGAHPVVIFTPGFTATFTDYTFLMEDLASRGYVVVSVAHTYETTAVELSDGRIAKSVFGSHLAGPMNGDDQSLSTSVYARLLDLKFVVNELGRLNAQSDSAFAGTLDLSKLAVAGHSLGGLTALLAIEFDPRLKAAVLMDGSVPSALPSATSKPVLLLAAGRERWEPTECRLWSNLAGPRLAVNLRGTEHVALGDWIWLTGKSVQTGAMGPEKTVAAIRDYIGAFLDANLKGDTQQNRLLGGPAAEYPDAAITTQEQALCANP